MKLLKRGKDVIEVSEESAKMLLKVKPLEYKIIESAQAKVIEPVKPAELELDNSAPAEHKPVQRRQRRS